MVELLAQGTAESVGIALGAAVLVLTGGKGLAMLAPKRDKGRPETRGTCPVHDQVVRMLDERHETLGGRLKDLREDHKAFEARTDDNFRELFEILRRGERGPHGPG